MMSVTIETEGGFVASNPKAILDLEPYITAFRGRHELTLHPDGERFLAVKRRDPVDGEHLVWVHNWLEEVKRKVPTN